jgi:hypothetical protein
MPQVEQAQQEHARRSIKKRVAFGLPLAALVAAGGIYVYLQLSVPSVKAADFNSIQSKADIATKDAGGDANAGLKIYDNAIGHSDSDSTRALLQLSAATLAFNGQLNDKALDYALRADTTLKSPNSSSLVAMIYAKQGNSSQAAAYYDRAASEVAPKQRAGHPKQYYQDAAKAAEGGGH